MGKKERTLRKRKMSGDTSEEDDHRGYHQKEEIIEEDPELELEREEQERLRDLEERDAFAKRMINKEHEMTRKRIQEEMDERDAGLDFDDIRIKSRREYLKKREEDKMVELEQEIKDDKWLFSGQKLTRREKARPAQKERILEISKQYKKVVRDEADQRYHIPEESRNKLNDKYVEIEEQGDMKDTDGNLMKMTDQQRWEQVHMKRATIKGFGAKDKESIS